MSAYELNRMMYDLRDPANRETMTRDPGRHLGAYELTAAERDLIQGRDWQGLIEAGVSVYVLTKLGAVLGVSLLEMGAQMRGESFAEFEQFIAAQNERSALHARLPDATGGHRG
ncbi:MAG: hypothetical protein ACRDZ5_02450 [Acidimicrobiales bacterium]